MSIHLQKQSKEYKNKWSMSFIILSLEYRKHPTGKEVQFNIFMLNMLNLLKGIQFTQSTYFRLF